MLTSNDKNTFVCINHASYCRSPPICGVSTLSSSALRSVSITTAMVPKEVSDAPFLVAAGG